MHMNYEAIREQLKIGNYGRAESKIDDLLWKDNDNAELIGLKGIALVYQGKYDEGINELSKSIQIEDKTEFRFFRSSAYFEVRNFDKSLEDAQKIVEIEEENPLFLDNLMMLYSHLGYVDESIELANKILSTDEDNIEVLMSRGYSFIIKGEYQKAIDDLKKILSQEYYQEDVFNNLGYCYDREFDYENASLFYEKALSMNPYHRYALNNLGLIYCRKGDVKRGEKMILESINYDDENSYAYKNMGKAKLIQGHKEEALEYLLKAKELNYYDFYDNEVNEILRKEFDLTD